MTFLLAQAAEACTDEGAICTWLYEQTSNQALAKFVDGVAGPLVKVAVIFVLASIGARLGKRFVQRLVDQAKEGRNPRMRSFRGDKDTPPAVNQRKVQRMDAVAAVGASLVSVLVWTIAVLTALGAFNIQLGPLLAGAGIIGVALGFGAQDLVKDFLSGLFMLAEDQFGVGDVIDAGDAVGVVEGISLRTTRIRDVTGTLWHVPNGSIARVGNMSQEWARALLDVGVSYGTDIDEASTIIKRVADEMAADDAYASDFLDEPAIWGVQNLGSDSIDIRLVIKTTPGTQWGIGRELRRRIKYALDDAEIEIPFPQRTVWLRTDATGTDRPEIEVGGDGLSRTPAQP